jgi:hypothetical protein
MAQDFGTGVTRTLSAIERQFQVVVWQAGKPPLDSELNLMMQADWERVSNVVRAQMHSGWLTDPFASDKDFITEENWANWFKVGRPQANQQAPVLWASVNGWIVPVTGTGLDGDPSNRVNLFPAPSTDSRIDFVFLEVWLAQVAPNPSEVNKPSGSKVYRWGNTEYGGTNIDDDLQDPSIGFETTERVQLQYRLRVFGRGAGLGDSVDLSTFPDGLDDPNVLAQGASDAPQVGLVWSNMRETLGDSGLWRSGDGNADNALGTVDGYTYAIPLCAVFRRNTASFVAQTSAGNANQNGSLDRNPVSAAIVDPVEGTRTFTSVTLTSAISATDTGAVQVEGLANSGLDNPNIDWASDYFLVIDQEVIRISGVDTTTTPGTVTILASGGRGRNGTAATRHEPGAQIKFYVFRPDRKTSDMISPTDILDLRKSVTPGSWDYQALLQHNLGKLFTNELRSSYKQASGSDTQGPTVIEVDTLWANGSFSVPNQTEALDGPDGIRTVFSDAATTEDCSVIIVPASGGGGNPTAVTDYTAGAGDWPAAGFTPSGFQPSDAGLSNGAVIELEIGGGTGNDGARKTVRDAASNRFVRFLSPREAWLSRQNGPSEVGAQSPVQIRFLEDSWGEPAAGSEPQSDHPGPLYPVSGTDFELPLIFLGGVVNSDLRSTSAVTVDSATSSPSGFSGVQFPGVDFDLAGAWYGTSVRSLSVEGVSKPLLYGARNLYDMLTSGGKDLTGSSSELYLVLTGDNTNAGNAGVFRVVGAGTAGYTTVSAGAADSLVLERVGESPGGFVAAQTVTAEVRSQYTHTEDGSVADDGASAVIVITDLESVALGAASPWAPGGVSLVGASLSSSAVIDLKVLYGPSRGGTARVADRFDTLALVGAGADMVREAPTALDTGFSSQAGVPSGETYFPSNYLQVWNRLPSEGLSAPSAPGYGDARYLKEDRRESELFIDPGSKTLVIRPLQRADISFARNQISAGELFPGTYTAGGFAGGATDGGNLFEASRTYGYSVPWEFMPRFGRQDIPVHQETGATGKTVFFGVNHLFGDSQTNTDDVFRVVGGQTSGAGVVSLFIQTGSTSGRDYGEYYNMGLSANGYQGRIYEDVNAYSSDLPHRGLKGIQLPPFLGVARIYGVYDLREFTGLSGFASDRATPASGGGIPKNLLRKDADKQTLFIVRGGGEDVTGNANDHTYLIPEDVIDITQSGSFTDGQTFDDIEFVVECVVFGFGRGFINLNNYVLTRNQLPGGGDPLAIDALATSVSAILNLPLPYNEQLYAAYTRTPYQGDPYMTRNGETKTTSDYEHRYGQIPQSGAFGLASAIQQYDSSSDWEQVPEIPNPRSLEVLASCDFHTTLGTGKMSGRVWSGTLTDVSGITHDGAAPGRIPSASGDPIWQSTPRVFTQKAQGRGFAEINIDTLTASAVSTGQSVAIKRGGVTVILVSDTDFTGGSSEAVATSLASAINSSKQALYQCGVEAVAVPGTSRVVVRSVFEGQKGTETQVVLLPVAGASRLPTGFRISLGGLVKGISHISYASFLFLPEPDTSTNGVFGSGVTPGRLTGLTERLPLGILLQDSDFLGEDPLRDGSSLLVVSPSGGSENPGFQFPVLGDQEYGRIQGQGYLGMADASVLKYQPWSISDPTGSRRFRLYRGGGTAYVLDPVPGGGPVDFKAGGLPEGSQPVLKGGILSGRAYLVRNFPEQAFSSPEQRSWGDEIQMVIVTEGQLGHGPDCAHGYSLSGEISPTGYGKGFAASDRYRLEGKPLVKDRTPAAPDPDLSGNLAPYPSEDEAEDSCP